MWVVRDVPSAFVASLRRIVPDYGAIDDLFAELGMALPDTARVSGHGAVWHRCAPKEREIDCEAVMFLDRPTRLPRGFEAYRLPACRAACVVHPSDEDAFTRPRAKPLAHQPFEIGEPMRERYFLERRRQALRRHRDPVSPSPSFGSPVMTVTLSRTPRPCPTASATARSPR